MHILYSFRRCPYAMRARMAIAVSGIQIELREVVLRNKPQALKDISPKATVPVLFTNESKIIDESLDIMYWALQQNDPENWLSGIDESLISNNDGEFKHWLDHYKYADRYPEQSEQFYRQRGEQTLLILEHRLMKTRYLSSDNISFTDIAIFPFIRQFAAVDQDWFQQSNYPQLQSWLNGLVNTDLFITSMRKHKQWQPEDSTVLFPAI
ncbi:MAG: glutathione S-transferase [Piscirickettsiaceae bacterium]|nr:glutathione S-transferase [Piscirickettsiaceae bacterium]